MSKEAKEARKAREARRDSASLREDLTSKEDLKHTVKALREQKDRAEQSIEKFQQRDNGNLDALEAALAEAATSSRAFVVAETYMHLGELNAEVRSSPVNGPDVSGTHENPMGYQLV